MSVDPVDFERKRSEPLPTLHFLNAAKYSFGGFKRLWRERAFREELVCLAIIVGLFLFAEASPAAYLVQLVLFLILVAVEALNTAIEELVDRVSPEISRFAKHAKDLGSFAVFCLLCVNGGFALFILARLAL